MADTSPPRITVVEAEKTGPKVKESLESLVSRSDSGSADEVEETEQTALSVPSSNKQRETSRKGRKISVNDALKVSRRVYEVIGLHWGSVCECRRARGCVVLSGKCISTKAEGYYAYTTL